MKKVVYLLILIVSLFIINNLIRSIFSLWQKHDLIGEAQKELQQEKNENQRLQDQLDRVKRAEFVEEEARNKLFMVKPGEKVVIMGNTPSSADQKRSASKVVSIPTWRQWWNLFF
jgi:cell division protein FtsB